MRSRATHRSPDGGGCVPEVRGPWCVIATRRAVESRGGMLMGLPTDDRQIPAWIRFDDWLGGSASQGSRLRVRGRGQANVGNYTVPGWTQEGFVIHSALIDPSAAGEALDTFHYRQMAAPSWVDARESSWRGPSAAIPYRPPNAIRLCKDRCCA